MNIATIHTLYGRRAGAELLFEKTVAGLLARYPDVSFAIYCNEEADGALPASESRMRKIVVPLLNGQIKKAFWLEFLARGVVEAGKPDLFWIPSGANSFPGPWNVPNVVTFLDLGEFFIRNKYDFKRTLYRRRICVPLSLRRAAVTTAISKHTAADLERCFPLRGRPRVVYPGPTPRHPASPADDAPAVIRAETGRTFRRIIFSPGRTDYQGKGRDLLLRAYADLVRRAGDAPPLVMAGPRGEGHQKMEDDIRSLNLGDRVAWLGRVSDPCIDALYAVSAMMVLPSRYEGFGFPVLEAMQHDVPVVCSDAGSLPEVAGEAALVFPSGNIEELAAGMLRLLTEDGARRALIAEGARQVRKFSWDATFAGMYDAFAAAMGNP
jgi:glycosyltransferase involved in cell wall biosynthesis